jgi:flavin prenyltransferase
MIQAVELGAIMVPPMPAFYHRPAAVADIVDQTVNRILDLFEIDLPQDLFIRWAGGKASRDA